MVLLREGYGWSSGRFGARAAAIRPAAAVRPARPAPAKTARSGRDGSWPRSASSRQGGGLRLAARFAQQSQHRRPGSPNLFGQAVSLVDELDLHELRQLPTCRVGLEAGGGAHYWARELTELGHEVRLMALRLVKPGSALDVDMRYHKPLIFYFYQLDIQVWSTTLKHERQPPPARPSGRGRDPGRAARYSTGAINGANKFRGDGTPTCDLRIPHAE